MGDFRKLGIWQRTRGMVVELYRATAAFPESERFGLTSQVRRAAISIAANIAESRGRTGHRDRLRLLQIACGSLRETECLLLLARDLEMLSRVEHDVLTADLDRIARMLIGLMRSDQTSLETSE